MRTSIRKVFALFCGERKVNALAHLLHQLRPSTSPNPGATALPSDASVTHADNDVCTPSPSSSSSSSNTILRLALIGTRHICGRLSPLILARPMLVDIVTVTIFAIIAAYLLSLSFMLRLLPWCLVKHFSFAHLLLTELRTPSSPHSSFWQSGESFTNVENHDHGKKKKIQSILVNEDSSDQFKSRSKKKLRQVKKVSFTTEPELPPATSSSLPTLAPPLPPPPPPPQAPPLAIPGRLGVPPAPPSAFLSCGTPSGFRPKPVIIPPAKMRRFHWNKIPNQNLCNTVWLRVDNAAPLERFEKYTSRLNREFTIVDGRRLSDTTVACADVEHTHENTITPPISFMNDKRAQVILVGMFQFRSFDAHPERLARAILEMNADALLHACGHFDGQQLDNELELRLEALQVCVALPDEAKWLHAYTGEPTSLRKAERWMKTLNDVHKFEQRIKFWLCKTRFAETVDELESQMSSIDCAVDTLMTSDSFCSLLHLILEIGNILNAGSHTGQSFGFRLSALRQLSSVRASDNKCSLLQLIAAAVLDDYPHVKQFIQDFQCIQSASKLDCDTLIHQARNLLDEIVLMQEFVDGVKHVSLCDTVEGDGLVQCLTPFLNKALPRIRMFHDMMCVTAKKVQNLMSYYGETKTTKAQQWFKMLIEFSEDFLRAESSVLRQRRMNRFVRADEDKERCKQAQLKSDGDGEKSLVRARAINTIEAATYCKRHRK